MIKYVVLNCVTVSLILDTNDHFYIIIPSQRKYYWCPKNATQFFMHCQFVISLLLPIKLSLFQLCKSKSCRSQSLCCFFYGFITLIHVFFSVLLTYIFCSSNYCYNDSCRSFALLLKIKKKRYIFFYWEKLRNKAKN